jgi:two-component system, response regulator YesN
MEESIMYKVLLVDDENLVLDSLENGVGWENSDFYVVGRANNGMDALNMIKDLKPHLVFTDIRMPGISGLELMKLIKETDKNIQCIVISGYAEFSYVQKSLNYGILGYCLKPFDDHEIVQLLKKAHDILDGMKQSIKYDLLDLLDEEPSSETILSIEKIFDENGISSETIHIIVSIGKEKIRFSKSEKYFLINLGNARNVYFVQSPDSKSLVRTISENIPEGILGIGIVQAKRDFYNLTDFIERATTIAWDFFIQGHNGVLGNVDPQKQIKAKRIIDRLEKALQKKDVRDVCTLLDELSTPSCKEGLCITDAIRIYNAVYFHAICLYDGINESDYIYSKEQLYNLFKSFDSMLIYLKETVQSHKEPDIAHAGRETRNENLREILKFIQQNYSSDITVQSISKDFYLNANYLSQIFRKELHLTFTEYLSKIRLDQAKNLLDSTERSTGEIAESVGIKDYFYFIKLFKKVTGQTPKQYRSRNQLPQA